ncbi:hypothetical protein GGF31_007301 [Allomyces arbusculus]|nr:hypothetical protein GGF31_007301 [Allomyces arbusculus]
MFTVDLKFPNAENETADDDGDVTMADTWAVHLILPARTAERKSVDLSGGLDAFESPAPKWSTIPIPRFQLCHVRIDVPGSLSIWSACRHLEIRGDWDSLGPAHIPCPPTVKNLTLTVYPVTPVALAAIGRFILHSAVTDLTLLIAQVPSDELLSSLLVHLTSFQHEFLMPASLPLIIDAITVVPKAERRPPMRLVKLRTLRVLNVAHNLAMREDLHPERWILALPLGLVELNVSMCQLPAIFGPLLLRAREKSGQHPRRSGMWLQIRAGGNFEIPNDVVKALINEGP